MPEDGSLRPRPMRRLLLAIARAAALFILVTGIYGAVAIGLPQTPVLYRSIASLLIGVIIYEMLRRPSRVVHLPAEPAADLRPPDNTAELLEAQHAVEQLRLEAEAARRREAESRKEFERETEHLQRAGSRALEEIQRIRTANDDLRGLLEGERTRVHALESQKAEVDQRIAASARELESLRADRQRARDLESQKAEAERRASSTAEELRTLHADHEHTRRALESQKAEAEKRAAATAQELEAMRSDRQRARRDVEEAKQKAEVEKAAQRKTIEADWAGKLKDIQRELELTRSSAQQLLQSNEALKQQLDEERQRLHAELQRIIEEGKGERDEMQAEARAVAARLDELLAQLDRERQLSRELGATRARLDEENAALKESAQAATQRERDLKQRLEQLAEGHETSSAGAQSLREQIAQMERDHAAARQQIETDWSAKLQKIVSELATDHENDMGEAIATREAARAEARSLHLRISKLEDDKKALKEQLGAVAPSSVDEKTLREKIDAEWSEKLQTIVSHIASDHEADVGNAILERETARAEVRNLNIKLTALQQKLEAERQARQSLQARFRETEDQLRNAPKQPVAVMQEEPFHDAPTQPMPAKQEEPFHDAPTQPMAAFKESFPMEPPAPEEEKRARADVLEVAEQAFEAIRRATSPGDVPLPEPEKKARILIVHHDPALRSMWRENLGKSGFQVQTAADGLEGLRVMKNGKPDVVIADASMPKMDGRELCHLIKSNPETADVKVILMTGMYTTEAPIEAAEKQYEADELLRKPVKPEAMKTALANILAARV